MMREEAGALWLAAGVGGCFRVIRAEERKNWYRNWTQKDGWGEQYPATHAPDDVDIYGAGEYPVITPLWARLKGVSL